MFYNFKCSKILKNFEHYICTAETYIIKLRSLSFRPDRAHGEYEGYSAAKQHFTQMYFPLQQMDLKRKKLKTTVTIKKKKPGHFLLYFQI